MNRKGEKILAPTALAFAASAAQYTHKQISVTRPSPVDKMEIIVANPSLVSDLVVKVFTKVTGLTDPTSMLVSTPITNPAGMSVTIEKSTGSVIEDCEDAWAESDPVTGVTVSADAVIYKVGTASAKMAVGADAVTGILATEAISSNNMSIYTHVRIWIRSSIATTAGQLQLLLDNTAACASPVETLDIPALVADTWTVVILPLSNPTALTAIISVGIQQSVDLGAFNLYIDDVQGIFLNAESFTIENFMNMAGMQGIIDLSLQTGLAADQGFSAIVVVNGL